jgi:hypothetical protein
MSNFFFILIPPNLDYEYLHPIYIFLGLEGIFRLTVTLISKVPTKYPGRRRAVQVLDMSMLFDPKGRWHYQIRRRVSGGERDGWGPCSIRLN